MKLNPSTSTSVSVVPTSKHVAILLTGGTGEIGACLAQILAPTPVPYLIASRSATKPQSVEFEWLDRSTWVGPFTRCDVPPVQAVLLLAPPVTESIPIMNALIDLARTKHGVKRFVLLGSTAVQPGGPLIGGTAKYLAELGARGDAEFAVLRPTWFQGERTFETSSQSCCRLSWLTFASSTDNWSQQDSLRRSIKDEASCYSAMREEKIPWGRSRTSQGVQSTR